MEQFQQYAPIIIVIVAYLYQNKMFVTPEQMERLHREILDEIKQDYANKTELKPLQDNISEIKDKIDSIYNILLTGRSNHEEN